MMRKLSIFLLVLLGICAVLAFLSLTSQAQNIEGQIIAAQFGQFQVPGQTTGSFQFPPDTCQVSGGGKNFAAFATGRPVKIVDANPAHTEIATPSSVFINGCTLNMATTYTHVPPYYLTSGTGGLQEAITNGPSKGGGPNTIILNADWYAQVAPGNPGTVISSVTGNTNVGLVDVTTTPYNWYQWNGTQYVAVTSGGGGGLTPVLSTYSTIGLAPNGRAYVVPAQITGGVTDAVAAIMAAVATLPSTGGTVDATGLGSATYTVTTRLALDNPTKPVKLLIGDAKFLINTSFATPTDSPASCAISVGNGSSIIATGQNGVNNFLVGPSAKVWDVVCNGSFSGNNYVQSMRLDGVNIQGNSSATVMGSLLHMQGLFVGTRVANSGTSLCYANCVEIDAGTSTTFSSDLVFDNDNFTDGATTGTYPGAVLTINALTNAGGLANIVFLGGGIQNNGPHNPLIVVNGQGGSQLQGLTFYNVDFTLSPAATSGYWSNVDPIQLADASNVLFNYLRVFGNINSTYQTHTIDISQTLSNNDYGIGIQNMIAYSASGWTCLVNNTINGDCETGFSTGHGDLALSYQYGGIVTPQITQSNTAPPGTTGVCVQGSLWTNSLGTTAANTVYQCIGTSGSQSYQAIGSGGGGATIPATNLVLKGTGTAGGSIAATPGTDYVVPTGSISGTAANLSGTPALPNGTTGTTQSVADNTTKLATDAFVLANGGGGAAFPGTNGLVKNTSTTASVTAVGTDINTLVNTLPNCSSNVFEAYIPFSAGCIPVVESYGVGQDQYVQQSTTNSNWTTMRVTNLNNTFYADGYKGYNGIGAAQVAYAGGTAYPLCQNVSYSGSNYIAVSTANASVTPGTNNSIWLPYLSNLPTQPYDCAWASAEVYKIYQNVGSEVVMGGGTYLTNGVKDIVTGNSFTDTFAVSTRGCGINCSILSYNDTVARPVIQRPTGAANFAYMNISDMTINGQYHASSLLDLGHLNQSVQRNLKLTQVMVGADHSAEIGFSGGDAFQDFMENVEVDPALNSQPNAGVFTANIVGGSVTSYTVNSGGSPFYANACGGGYTCYVALLGYQGGGHAQPCTVMPTGQVVTISGGAVTAISEGTNTGGSGCVGPIDVQVYQTFPQNYGIIWNASDSTMKDVTLYAGQLAGLLNNGGDDVFLHVHPSVIPVGILQSGGWGQYVGTELDTIFLYGFEFQQPFTDVSTAVTGTQAYYPWVLPGASPYVFESATSNVNIANSSNLCGTAKPTDWHWFVGQSGVIDTQAEYLSSAPGGLVVTGNDVSCPSSPGDYIPTLTVKNLDVNGSTFATLGANTFTGAQTINNSATIAGAANLPALTMGGTSWNPSGNAFQVTSDYAFGTNFALINSTSGGQSWGFISGGTSDPIPGAFGISNGPDWPLTLFVNSTVPTAMVPSNGDIAFSTASAIPGSTAQNAGLSNPSAGVISADTTTVGNSAATFKAVIPVADLNGGTAASGTTFWRGDGTWAVPAGSGSGTVTSGTAWSPTYYGATGNTVVGTTPFTGLEYFPGSAAPVAATPANMLSLVGYYTGTYSGSVTYKANDIAVDGSGNNYISLSAGNVGNALTNVTYWHFLGGVSSTITGGNCATTGQVMYGISTAGVPVCASVPGFNGTAPQQLFSAAGTPLPTCNSGLKGAMAIVSDATSPTYNGTYTSGGAVTVPVICPGSAPWLTH
jgi:hypothetical protein